MARALHAPHGVVIQIQFTKGTLAQHEHQFGRAGVATGHDVRQHVPDVQRGEFLGFSLADCRQDVL